jgi:hypothetical protein
MSEWCMASYCPSCEVQTRPGDWSVVMLDVPLLPEGARVDLFRHRACRLCVAVRKPCLNRITS